MCAALDSVGFLICPQTASRGGTVSVDRLYAMFFRFAAALLLVVAVSMAQVALEKESLRLRRQVSRQYYQMDELLELHAQLRLEIQTLSAPSQLLAEQRRSLPQSGSQLARRHNNEAPPPAPRRHHPSNLPLLRWELPVRPDGGSR